MLTAAKIAEKWKRNLSGAAQSMKDGIDELRDSPMERAIEQQAKMMINWQKAVEEGRWAAGLQSVSLAQWKDLMIKVGIPRAIEGATKKADKVQKFFQEFLPVAEAVKAEAASMPSQTDEDAIAKVRMMMERFKQFAHDRRS